MTFSQRNTQIIVLTLLCLISVSYTRDGDGKIKIDSKIVLDSQKNISNEIPKIEIASLKSVENITNKQDPLTIKNLVKTKEPLKLDESVNMGNVIKAEKIKILSRNNEDSDLSTVSNLDYLKKTPESSNLLTRKDVNVLLEKDKDDDEINRKNRINNRNSVESVDMSDYVYENDEQEKTCQPLMMSIYNVAGNHQNKSVKASPIEKSYCRRNKSTCCNFENIESTNLSFAHGAKKLKQKFEMVEELLSLFRGGLYTDFIQEHESVGNCKDIVQDLKIEINDTEHGFFDHMYIKYQSEMMFNLLMDTELYVKKNLWFYGDNICSICSPRIQEYFELNKEGSSVKMHINTCSERAEEREYEKNLLLLFSTFLKPTVEFFQCVKGQEDLAEEEDDEETSPSTENEHSNVLIALDKEQTETFLTTFETCWEDQNVLNQICKDFCVKHMRNYSFPITNLFHNLKVTLAVLYEALTTKDIAEYYEEIKLISWGVEDENEPIEFFPETDDWRIYQMDTLKWEFHTSGGHNVYKEIMSKKYLNFESVSRILTGALIVFSSLFVLA